MNNKLLTIFVEVYVFKLSKLSSNIANFFVTIFNINIKELQFIDNKIKRLTLEEKILLSKQIENEFKK